MKKYFKNKIAAQIFKLVQWQEDYNLQKTLSNPNIRVGEGLKIDKYFSLRLPFEDYNISIGQNVIIRKFCNIDIHRHASLIIENNVFLNNYCSINCLSKITIGENTLFGEGVKIYDHNHQYNYNVNELKVQREKFNTSEIVIGRNCWIGSGVTILKGVSIGDNVIIGAHSFIYKSVPSNTIVKAQTNLAVQNF